MVGTERHDVIVIGAGPAGSRTARELARAGLKVALLEEHRDIGRPCHCSGLVSPRTLELSEVGEDIVLNHIRGALIHLTSHHPIAVGGDRIHALVIDRAELDRRLAKQATDAGVALLRQTRFLRYRLTGQASGGPDSGEVVVSVLREGTETELRARLLIGADGALSKVAEQIRGSPPARMVMGLGASAAYANPRLDHVELFVDPGAAPGWFGWTIPLGVTSARVGTGSANGIKPLESLERLRERFPHSFGGVQVDSYSGGLIAVWEPTPLAADRVLLVGDAARQVKPTSGGGIHAALYAAPLAAAVAHAAIIAGDHSRRGLEPYARTWRATLGQEMRRGHDLRRILTKLDHPQLDHLARVLRHDDVRREIDAAGDIDFPSRITWALVKRAPSLWIRLATVPRFPLAWLPARRKDVSAPTRPEASDSTDAVERSGHGSSG